MRRFSPLLPCLLLLLFSCGPENEPPPPPDSAPVDTLVLSPGIKPDTVYPLFSQGKRYWLVLTRDEFRLPKNENRSTTTVRIVEDKNRDTLLTQTFDFNTTGEFKNPAAGIYWLELLDFGGGSGYYGTLFNVRFSPQPALQPIVDYNELSWWKSNKDATALLLFQGNWVMGGEDDADFEAHFSDHKQWIGVYTIQTDTVVLTEIGATQYKYNLFEDAAFLDSLRAKEPELAEKIGWTDFE